MSILTNTAAGVQMRAQQANVVEPAIVRMDDPVYHPAHYTQGATEVWDFIYEQGLDYFLGNAMKYICRAGKKSPETKIEDLLKANAYIKKEIEILQQHS
jgi:hypothetical protein